MENYYLMLILELNEPKLVNDFGQKIIDRVNIDTTAPKLKTAEQIVKSIAQLDPTSNKELTFWLCLNYSKGLIKRWEDIASRSVPALLKYKALLRKLNLEPKLVIRDINQIKGLEQLEEILDLYPDKAAQSNSELASTEEQNFYKTDQAELVYNDSQVKVVIPKTKGASCFFGINTRWCTAAKNNNRFAYYNKRGPLYIVLLKAINARYQFHFESNQFMDERDREINPRELAEQYPILWKIFTPISQKNKSLVLYLNPPESAQLAAVKKNGWAIQYIKNPSEALQLIAVQQNGYAIKYIKKPSEALQLAAVQQDGWAIQYIKKPRLEIQIAAVQQDYRAIQYIKNPSEAVQLAAVKKNGWAIEYIKNPSEAVQLAAVQQDGWAIDYIKNPSEAVQLAAVKSNGYAIKYIKKPTPKVIALAKSKGYPK
jgi:hypothetical protein